MVPITHCWWEPALCVSKGSQPCMLDAPADEGPQLHLMPQPPIRGHGRAALAASYLKS
jgi:hypothetical protein